MISTIADTDSFTIDIDDGQTISVVVDTDSSLQAAVQLFNPGGFLIGSASAGVAGEDAVIQVVPTVGAGTYTVTVGGAGGTTGTYSVQIILNAAVEVEEHNGLPNDTRLTAQDLSSSFLGLGFNTAERGAVLGRGDGDGGSLIQTQNDNVYYPNVLTFDFSGAPAALGDGVLTVSTVSDLGSSSEHLVLGCGGTFHSELVRHRRRGNKSFASTTVDLTQAQLATLMADDGAITFTVTPKFRAWITLGSKLFDAWS